VTLTQIQRAVALTAVAVAMTTTATAVAGVNVSEGGRARFPDRLYLLNLDTNRTLKPTDVQVRENGRLIQGIEVTPARSAAVGQVGVVLVLDSSLSMHGKPIAGAMEAARTFINSRNANEQIAVVMFSNRARVVQPFTTDGGKLRRALGNQPALSEGTRIYDTIETALALLTRSRAHVGSIVLLSDGADTGSAASLERSATAAARAHVRIFTIGLRSGSFDRKPLRILAATTSGSFAETSDPTQLAPIFSALSTHLANEYLLSYRSPAGPGANVSVTVTVAGAGASVVSYATPSLPSEPTGPFYPSVRDKVWRSPAATITIALLIAACLGIGVALLTRPRPKTLRARLGQFVSMPIDDGEAPRGGMLTRRLGSTSTDAPRRRRAWWLEFRRDVELADLVLSPERIAAYTVASTIIGGFIFTVIASSPIGAVAGLVVPFAVVSTIRRRVRRKRDLFSEQLPDNLQVLASALRAGHSLVGALSVVVEDAEDPTKSEFRRVVADEQLGVPLEDALQVVVERMQSSELGQVALVASLQRRTGGNSAEVLDRVVETIRERAELRRLVKTLTAQGRASRWIVTALPIFLLLVISLINPHYIAPLIHTGGGRIALLVAGLFVASGSVVIDRIVDIKV
jgi:tight adherence protein B